MENVSAAGLKAELHREFYAKLGIKLIDIHDENEADDIRLRESNTYFYSRVYGEDILPPDRIHPFEYCKQDEIEVRKDRYILPEGMPAQSKLYFGLFDEEERFLAADPGSEHGRCLAIIDLVQGYPTEEYAYIGWLILDSEVHHTGLAQGIMDVVYSCGRKIGLKYIKLSAYEVNEIGLRFWKKQGFEEDGFVMREVAGRELKLFKFIKEL